MPKPRVTCPLAATLLPAAAVLLFLQPAGADTLEYKDGDRVQGQFISEEGGIITFRSPRFGELKVPSTQAQVTHEPMANASAPSSATPAATATSLPTPSVAPAPKTDTLPQPHRFFGLWHGHFALSSEVINDSGERRNLTIEGRLERKWARDELRLTSRYEFSRTGDTINTDLIKNGAYWRHDLSKRFFTLYQPSLESNRNYFYENQPADYLLLKQEFGLGVTIWNKEKRKFRAGLSEIPYDVWLYETGTHFSQTVPAAFFELEFILPWNIKITNRGTRFIEHADKAAGWENIFEFNKRLSEQLSLSLIHEVRYNSPDFRLQDYSNWRLMIGLDF